MRDEVWLASKIAARPLLSGLAWMGLGFGVAYAIAVAVLDTPSNITAYRTHTGSIVMVSAAVSALVAARWAGTHSRILRLARGRGITAYAALVYATQCGSTLAASWAAFAACEAMGAGEGALRIEPLPALAAVCRWGALAVLVTSLRRTTLSSIAWTLLLGWLLPAIAPFVAEMPARGATPLAPSNVHTFAMMVADIGAALAFSVAAILLERHSTTNA